MFLSSTCVCVVGVSVFFDVNLSFQQMNRTLKILDIDHKKL